MINRGREISDPRHKERALLLRLAIGPDKRCRFRLAAITAFGQCA